jgi:O-antigen/teichoic acid export membrane protein
MRSKKAFANIITSLTLQLITAICGFIVPRYILMAFGSNVNGLTASITQFLGYIALIEGGIGGVTRAALYKPLAKNNVAELSEIIKATEIFFKKLAYIFIIYMLILSATYPMIVKNDFEWLYTASLVIILGVSTFVQYYFGISYQMLLQADQKQYFINMVQVATLIINTVLTVALIKYGASIHVVRLGSAIIFIARPILYNRYVHRKYKLIKECKPNYDALNQRWSGLGHHIAYFIRYNTDIVVLTLFTSIKEVSVYSIHFMIVNSITNITKSFSVGIEAAFGNMISNNESEALLRNFRVIDFILNLTTVILFTVTDITIVSFVMIYTKGITDTNYYNPLFAFFLVLAHATDCLRIPYQSVALAAGKYKETRNGAFIEAIINIVISIILVNFIGLIGVAIGTFIAMAFRTIQYAVFSCKYLLHINILYTVKRFIINIINVIAIIFFMYFIHGGEPDSYFSWGIWASKITLGAFCITISINILFYYHDFKNVVFLAKNLLLKK